MLNFDFQNSGMPDSFNYFQIKSGKKTDNQVPEWVCQTVVNPPKPLSIQFEDLFSQKALECKEQTTSHNQSSNIQNFKHGTTTLGFVFQGGVILAVDSRASMGSFLSSEQVRKVIEINDYLLGTMAGGAADCQYWEAYLATHCREYELKNGRRLTVAGASKYLQNILHHYRGRGLSAGVMIAGVDDKGPQLFYNDDNGIRLKGNKFSVGSGSTYAYGVLDTHYSYDMSVEAAIEVGVRAIYHATHRDTGSGGVVRVYHIHQNGWTKIHEGLDANQLHYKFAKEKGLIGDQDEAPQRLF